MTVRVEIQVNLHLPRFSIQDTIGCPSCPGETPGAAVFAASSECLDEWNDSRTASCVILV
jgi:hypothetical protein